MEASEGKHESSSLGVQQLPAEKSGVNSSGRSRVGNSGFLKHELWQTAVDGIAAKKLRRNSREEISLSNAQSAVKKGRRNVNVPAPKTDVVVAETGEQNGADDPPHSLCNSDNISGSLYDSDTSPSNGSLLHPIEENGKPDQNAGTRRLSSCLGGDIVIPKRSRGASRRKKSETSLKPKRAGAGLSDFFPNLNSGAQSKKFSGDSVTLGCATISKRKKILNELKKGVSSRSRRRVLAEVALPSKDEEASTGKVIKEVHQRSNRKRKISTIEKESSLDEGTLSIRKAKSDDRHQDDEENLEHNAAKMLSSRFDPSCTGGPTNGVSPEEAVNEPAQQFSELDSNGIYSESSAVDAAGRLLRPRKQDFKCFIRKRRHFYEVHANDMDPYWVVKRRIKIFQPLGQTWHFSLVKDYNPDVNMHLVKYDDRNEEWTDLQNERIKLLLFPSEFTGKLHSKKVDIVVKTKNEDNEIKAVSNKCTNNLMESEPIISWLTHLTRGLRKSSLKITTDNRESYGHKDSKNVASLSNVKSSKLSTSSFELETVAQDSKEVPTSRKSTPNRRFSFIYSRRRFCKIRNGYRNTRVTSSDYGTSLGSIRHEGVPPSNTSFEFMKLEKGVLDLRVLPSLIRDSVFPSERRWVCGFLELLQYGAVLRRWPMVHMEVIVVDKAVGLRSITFEGCIRHVIAILCLIMRLSQWSFGCRDFVKLHLPFALSSFKFSGLQVQGRHPVFMANCLELESSKWDNIDSKLNQYCALTSKVLFPNINYASVKNFLGDSDLTLLVCEAISLEDSQSTSSVDITCEVVLPKHGNQDMNIVCDNYDSKHDHPLCALSSAVDSTTFPTQHLKLLPENEVSSAHCLQNCDAISAHDTQENHEKITDSSCSRMDDSSDQVSDVTLGNMGSSLSQTAEGISCSHPKVEADALSVSSDGDCRKTSQGFLNSENNITDSFVGCWNSTRNENSKKFMRSQRLPRRSGYWRAAWKPCSPFLEEISSPEKSDDGGHSYLDAILQGEQFKRVEAPDADQSESDFMWKSIQGPSPTARGIREHCSMQNFASPSFRYFSRQYSEDSLQDGYSNCYRMPRTQVSYSLSPGECDFSSKSQSHQQKGHSSKKIKTDNTKKSSIAGSRSSQSYLRSSSCEANVLVTEDNRGWREHDAQVVLDSEDQDWKLLVKISGITRFSCKADQFLQPGTTNRYTHAMMWKGGSNWTLEFTDRSQWALFKEMHEKCYNWNIRAASVKNIPIPGVRLIEENYNDTVEVPFMRCPSQYIRQDETEVDMAMDPSRSLYDMDSDDEEFISKLRSTTSNDGSELAGISDDLFENAIDMLEKFAYAQNCNEYSDSEIGIFLAEIGPLGVTKPIYEYWHLKRLKKGVPLIRQFQPALWEQYQKQLKEWELAVNRMANSSNLVQESILVEKPPMFAFCLRPRGLQVPNKGYNQRLHKKFTLCRNQNALPRRKLNKPFVEDDDAYVTVPNYVSSESSLWLQLQNGSSPRKSINAAVEINGGCRSDRIRHSKLHRSNSRRMGIFQSHKDRYMFEHVNGQRTKRSGFSLWSPSLPEYSTTKKSQSVGFRRDYDIEEFRLRDAANAAQHALKMAKLKREKAQWLFHKADLALHKAAVALITAETFKASEEDATGDV